MRFPAGLGRRQAIATLFVLALLAGAMTVIVSQVAFPHGTADLDEVAYVSQANAISHHELTLPASTHDPFFRPFLSGARGDRVVFKYQPEWPALIAASSGLFGSTLPLRVMMAIGGVLAVAWFAWELTRDRRVAVLAAALLVASPFTWVQTASLLGYQLSFVLGTAAVAAFVRAGNAPSPRHGLLAGVLLGLAVFHRPFDALLATAPVLVYWSWTAWRRHTLARGAAPVVIGAAPFAAVFLAYDRAVMGSVARLAYNVTGPADAFGFGWRASFEVPGGGHDGQIDYTIGRAWSTLGHLFVALPRVVAFAPAVVVLVGVALWTRRRDARIWLLAAMFVVVVAGYFFWWGVSNSYHFELDRSLGPFYYYPVLAPLCVLAAWGAVLIRRTVALGAVIVVVGLAWAGVAAPSVLRDARRGGDARTAEIDALRVPTPSLVLDAPLFPNDPYLRVAADATLRRRDLVAVDVPGRRLELVDRFPDRAAYLVQSFHRFGDFLGPEQRERVELRVARGNEVTARVQVRLAPGRAGRVYVRIGRGAPEWSSAGRGAFDATIRLAPALLAPAGASTEIAVGVAVGEPGAAAPTSTAGNGFECRSEARATAVRAVEVLRLCDGRHHYLFPTGTSATAVEDVSPALRVTFSAE